MIIKEKSKESRLFMENTKYIEIEDRFHRVLESNYNDEEKILILHGDLVDVIRSSKE